jgi:hypothetical protein
MGFETTIPVLERTKIVQALDRAATVIGDLLTFWVINSLTIQVHS